MRRPFRVSGHAEKRMRERLGFTAPASLWDAFMDAIDGRRCRWREGTVPGTRVYLLPVTDPEVPELELTLPVVFDPATREFITVYDLKDAQGS